MIRLHTRGRSRAEKRLVKSFTFSELQGLSETGNVKIEIAYEAVAAETLVPHI